MARRRIFDAHYGSAKIERGKPTGGKLPPPDRRPPVPLGLTDTQGQPQPQPQSQPMPMPNGQAPMPDTRPMPDRDQDALLQQLVRDWLKGGGRG